MRPLRFLGRVFKGWFNLIQEPRAARLLQFTVYLLLVVVGTSLAAIPPEKFTELLGELLTFIFGTFLLVGGVMGAIGVMWLPGAQWIERAGIVALTVGWLIFLVVVVALGGSVAGFGFGAAFALMLTIRYLDIRPLHIPKQT